MNLFSPLEPLPLAQWEDTRLYLQLVCQIVGKTRQALHPRLNHWWHVSLYVSPRGLTTGPIPSNRGPLEIELDLLDHLVVLRTDRASREVALAPRPLAAFYAEFMGALAELGRPCSISIHPYDNKSKIPYPEDTTHTAYDPAAVTSAWHSLTFINAALWEFRGRFIGKCSPVHFFWHSFDLAVTRFSGRAAPNPPEQAVAKEAYSHEVCSAGFWFGDDAVPEPAFYCYGWPVPDGLDARSLPKPARWVGASGEFQARMMYEDWRALPDPPAVLLDFLQSSYEAVAGLSNWDRALLERSR